MSAYRRRLRVDIIPHGATKEEPAKVATYKLQVKIFCFWFTIWQEDGDYNILCMTDTEKRVKEIQKYILSH